MLNKKFTEKFSQTHHFERLKFEADGKTREMISPRFGDVTIF